MPPSEAHVDQLSQILSERMAAAGNLWLLIDPVLRPVERGTPLGKALGTREAIILNLPGQAPEPLLMPTLVRIDGVTPTDDQALIRQSAQEALEETTVEHLSTGAGRRICAWIEYSGEGQILAQHLSANLIQVRESGLRFLLRWYDPAVLWPLWSVFHQGQGAALLGPVQRYHFLGPGGHWVHASPSPAPEHSSPDALALTPGQWCAIDSIAAFNRVLFELPERPVTLPQWDALQKTIMSALLEANLLGFRNTNDLKTFAQLALDIHPLFYQHPLVAQRLQHRTGDERFTALMDDLTPTQWAEIGETLPAVPASQSNLPERT